MNLKITSLLLLTIAPISYSAMAQQDPGPNAGDTSSITFTYKNKQVRYKTVRGKDGKVWLQQNLGSERVAQSTRDTLAYGDYFQWGRWDDGHQERFSTVDVGSNLNPNNPSGIAAGSNKYYTNWWADRPVTATWSNNPVSKTNGADPCAAIGPGWRLPAIKDWSDFVTAEKMNDDTTDAFRSTLKLTPAGYRHPNGSYGSRMSEGAYWSTTNNSASSAYILQFTSGASPFIVKGTGNFMARDYGYCIRCVKNCQVIDTVDATVCFNKSYQRPNGEVMTESGTYLDIVGEAKDRCDSVVITQLVVLPELKEANVEGKDTICADDVNVYSVPAPSQPVKYIWNLPEGWSGTGDSPSVSITSSGNEGLYEISGYMINECGDSAMINPKTIYLSAPYAEINIEEDILGVTGTFKAYQWFLNGASIAGATQSKYKVLENGSYTVEVTNEFGCKFHTEAYQVESIISVNELAMLSRQISVFPNPAGAFVYIKTPVEVHLNVFTIEGKEVIDAVSADRIDISSLNAGLYLIKITDSNGHLIKVEKLVKSE